MRTVIEGGWVVAWNGKSHEVHEQGSVVFEGDRVVHAGPAWTGAADTRIAARGKLVSPGFINTHVHTAGGGGDYLQRPSRFLLEIPTQLLEEWNLRTF